MLSNSWYSTVNTEMVEQGDLFEDVPIIATQQMLVKASQIVNPSITTYDMIVLTQSCDLINMNKVTQVQLAHVMTLKDLLKKNKTYNKVDWLNKLRTNNINRYYLLNTNRGKTFGLTGLLVVDFGNVRSVPIKTMLELGRLQPNRRRLISPYLEQMSQQFARFYMRVGLPYDIKPFDSPIKLS